MIAAVALVIGLVIALGGGGDDGGSTAGPNTTTTADAGPGEIILQPIADVGPDPFGPSAAAPPPPSTVPPGTPVTLGQPPGGGPPQTAPAFPPGPPAGSPGGAPTLSARSGATPGLYGGTRNQSTCDKQQMISFLAANPAKTQAWADVQGIPPGEVGRYIDGLTPVLLRGDTRVTNHGYSGGQARPINSVLQAGTAVLVDQFGLPRARCACGNPLLPPRSVPTGPVFKGDPWSGFSPSNITVVITSTTVINVITVIDVQTGTPYGKPTGPGDRPDLPLPPLTTPPTSPPSTVQPPSTFPTAPTTAPGGSGSFTLVDVSHTISELRQFWTVNDRAGTARIDLQNGNTSEFFWTVPQRLEPGVTRITYGGSKTGNMSVDIKPYAIGPGIVFNPADPPAVAVRGPDPNGVRAQQSAVLNVTGAVNEVKLQFSMGYSINAVYTYRR